MLNNLSSTILSSSVTKFAADDERNSISSRLNLHDCPSCNFETLMGMPGSADAICKNCGFKEPCCAD